MISIVIISKDESSLDETLNHVTHQAIGLMEPCEIVVVDASSGRLDHIRRRHENQVRWVQFVQPAGVRVSIPHQRNVGVREAYGEIVVFTDAGCQPEPRWLAGLVAPLHADEHVTVGLTLSTSASTGLYDRGARQASQAPYLTEASSINLAFRRSAFNAVDGFDQRFAYGSDVDFTWRLTDAGYKLRSVPTAVVRHDWGGWRRQLRRSYVYGQARMGLYRKHPVRLRTVLRDNPMVIAYPMFILGLPLTLIFHFYPTLLLIPMWRNRSNRPVRVLVDHLIYGVGVLAGLVTR